MQITVVTPPPFEPVSMAQVYAHLRLIPYGDPPAYPPLDAALTRMIRTAREQVEQMTRRAIIKQTLMIADASFSSTDAIELKRAPYLSGASVTYYDSNNAPQTLDPSAFYIDDVSDIVTTLSLTGAAPATYARTGAVRITYVAGYPPVGVDETQEDYAANVPASLKDAILLGVQLLYDELKPDERAALEETQRALLSSYHVFTFA